MPHRWAREVRRVELLSVPTAQGIDLHAESHRRVHRLKTAHLDYRWSLLLARGPHRARVFPIAHVLPQDLHPRFDMRTISLVAGCFLLTFSTVGVALRPPGVRAGTALKMELPEVVGRADLILEARVLSARALESDGMIETEFLLQVDRTFHGEDQPFRLVRIPGGVLEDGRGMILAGMPRLALGERTLLFLSEEGETGIRMPVGLAQGKYTVVEHDSGAKELVQHRSDLTLVSPGGELLRGEGSDVLSYAQMVAEIEAALVAEGRK